MSASVEVRVDKRFRHPPEQVFDAFVDPAQVGDWLFHTPGGVMVQTDYDPEQGGGFALFEQRGETMVRHFGRFVEVRRPERIVFDFWTDAAPDAPVRVVVTFEPDGEGCRVTLGHDLPPDWADFAERSAQGWLMILDSLETVMETPR